MEPKNKTPPKLGMFHFKTNQLIAVPSQFVQFVGLNFLLE